jgi:hypothetical protein
MDDINVPIFSQAKLEYTKQLVDILYMNIYDGIRSIYDDAKVVYVAKRSPILVIFRSLLEQVPKWNSEIIQKETDRIEKTSKCDWLDELLTAVFISHTRILMSIGSNHNFNKINVTIPKTTTFIHKSYINIAREVWKNPYLFDEQVPGHEYQRNMKQLEGMIKLTIEDTIRRQLPIKEILREHLENANEPKQPQTQMDMKTLVDEIRRATNNDNNESSYGTHGEDNGENNISENNISENNFSENNISENNFSENNFTSIFNKEEASSTGILDSPTNVEPGNIVSNGYVTPAVTSEVSPFSDAGDPDDDQIKKATQNIVLNDITEPVVEPSYDNTDIVSPTKSGNNDNKLENMVKELSMDKTEKQQQHIVKIDKLDTTTSNNTTTTNPTTTIVKKEERDPKPISNTVKTDVKEISPFSFDNLYSTIKGTGKVEEVSDDKTKNTIVIKDTSNDTSNDTTNDTTNNRTTTSINADIMKEVISLDKKEEQIDDTKSLDVFFSDIQKMANPSMDTMEPIKEESKYTLFEDASYKE